MSAADAIDAPPAIRDRLPQVNFDIVFLIGTSALFPYVARPVLLAKSEGVPTIEINPATTDLSDVVDFRYASTAKHALRALWIAFKSQNVMATRLGR